MNNILLVNICLLATVAVVCSYSMVQGFGGNSFLPTSPPAAPGHVSETERRSNFWSRTVTRQRRDASEHKGGRGHKGDPFSMCCNVEKTPEMDAYMEKVAAIFKECQDENKSDEKGGKKFGKVMECVAKNRKMIDDEGNLNEEEIKTIYKEMPLQDYQKNIAEAAVTSCVAKTKESEGGKGGPIHKFQWCMAGEFMKVCPDDKQDTSKFCVRMREGKGPGNGETQ